MLCVYAKREWLTILAVGVMFGGTFAVVGWWWLLITVVLLTAALLSFFRDPDRSIPAQRGIVVSPADGRVTSVHRVEHFEPLDGAAVCVRVFLSVLNVHVNRSPCHGTVESVRHQPGKHHSALRRSSSQNNESNLIVLVHPARRRRVAAIRQVAGLLARSIVCRVKPGQVLQRGQRLGMIKLGSTTELYLPDSVSPEVVVQKGQRVKAGLTVLAKVNAPGESTGRSPAETQVSPPAATVQP